MSVGMNCSDLARLGPNAQKQVLQKLGAQQRQREARHHTVWSDEAGTSGPRLKKTGNKYNAKKTEVLLPDGTVRRFDSQKEADRFRELDLMQRSGRITGLQCQVPFVLVPRQKREDGKTEQPVKYIADFVYRQDGRKIVEDVKGYTDTGSPAYKLYTVKRKLMLHVHGITIKEI